MSRINNYLLFVAEAVEARESRSCYKLSSLKLCIRKYSESRPSIAQLIPLIFPQLDQLVIHHVHPREFESLAHLAGLARLSSLTVGGVGLQYISPVLELRGQQLRELRLLCYGGNNSKINLSLICLTCPLLLARFGRCCLHSSSLQTSSMPSSTSSGAACIPPQLLRRLACLLGLGVGHRRSCCSSILKYAGGVHLVDIWFG